MIQLPEGITLRRVTPDTIFSPNAPPEDGYRVEFTTPDGTHTFIKVPRGPDWHENAAMAVAEEAQRVAALHNRFGTVLPIRAVR